MFLARLLVPVLLCAALYWSLRLGYADELARRGAPADLAHALALTPGDARLYARLDAGLETASKLNPWGSGVWIQRGLQCELEGRIGEAERLLLEAARVDHTFKPLWTLANFYVRANRPDRLWPYARACLNIENRDPIPIFDLCWKVTENDRLIAAAIPPSPAVLSQYLRYLIRTQRRQAAAAAYSEVLGTSDTSGVEHAPLFLDYCDFLLAGSSIDAVHPWNAITAEKLDPEHGISLTNGDLSHSPTGRGFDWHLPTEPGISANLFRSSSILRISMDGDENEDAGLLWQMLPLVQRRRYRLQFRYQTADIPPASGLHWWLGDLKTGADRSSADLSSDSWREDVFDFETPSTPRLVRLSLSYKRPLGAMRLKGSISLAHVNLSLRP